MTTRFTLVTLGLVSAPLCLSSGLEASRPRVVEIRYDFRNRERDLLRVWIDGVSKHRTRIETSDSSATTVYRTKPFGFELRVPDTVILHMTWRSDCKARCDSSAGISYAVKGYRNTADILKGLLKKVADISTSTPKQVKTNSGATLFPISKVDKNTFFRITPVTDDLAPGGHLIVTFNKKRAKNGTVSQSSPPLIFRIQSTRPRFTVTTGLLYTYAPNPTVGITKRNASANKDATVSAGKQRRNSLNEKYITSLDSTITVRGGESRLQPIQAPVLFVNGLIVWRIYGSVGFKFQKQPFREPILGLTWRGMRGGVGINVTAGLHSSRETELISDSGLWTAK